MSAATVLFHLISYKQSMDQHSIFGSEDRRSSDADVAAVTYSARFFQVNEEGRHGEEIVVATAASKENKAATERSN
jgi:hypothetical protein